MNDWIESDKRLPAKGTVVLGFWPGVQPYSRHTCQDVLYDGEDGWFDGFESEVDAPTHWTTLPTFPTTGEVK